MREVHTGGAQGVCPPVFRGSVPLCSVTGLTIEQIEAL